MERKKIKPLTQTQKEFLAYSKGIADSDLMNQVIFYMTGMKKMIRINGMDSVIHALR